ncbi:unnamed protein product, partial [Ectocarpus sp. 12 AP-2014]
WGTKNKNGAEQFIKKGGTVLARYRKGAAKERSIISQGRGGRRTGSCIFRLRFAYEVKMDRGAASDGAGGRTLAGMCSPAADARRGATQRAAGGRVVWRMGFEVLASRGGGLRDFWGLGRAWGGGGRY